jgi:nucleoside-diphosphate-sugar epimerase
VGADFIIVHLSMIGALAISVVSQTALGNSGEARTLTSDFAHYYTAFFWLLSPVFPLVFLLNGFYTHLRASGKRKTWLVLRGVALAVTVFFGINVLLFGQTSLGRRVTFPFMILAGVGLASARLLKACFEEYFEVRPRKGIDFSTDKGRVLVIGGAGYIGSLLVERLLESGYRVRVLDSLLYGDEPLRSVKDHPGFELLVGDCRNTQAVVKAMRGAESVIALAAIVGDPACDQNPEAALETNYAATRMLIEIAKGHGVRRLLFASSCSVYGASDVEVDENATVRPISLYGQTKVDSEEILLRAKTDTFHPTILRFATVFGLSHRPRFDLVVNLLTAKARQESAVTIFNGQQWRPFIHVRDLVQAIVGVLEAPVGLVSGEIFNVGDKRLNHTLTQVAEIIAGVFPNVRVERIDNSDRRNYRVNFQKLLDRTGFQAHYTLLDGVEELRRAFDKGLIPDYTDVRYHNQRYLQTVGTHEYKNEFDASVMAAHAGTFRQFTTELLLRRFRDQLAAVATPEECWEVLRKAYSHFGFEEIRFKIGDQLYCHSIGVTDLPRSCTIRLQLTEADYLNLSGEFAGQSSLLVPRVLDVIAQTLSDKIPAMLALPSNSESLGKGLPSYPRAEHAI